MNSATAFRSLILVIPVAWVIIRLMPAEHPRYGNLRAISSQAQEEQSHHMEQGTTGWDESVTRRSFAISSRADPTCTAERCQGRCQPYGLLDTLLYKSGT